MRAHHRGPSTMASPPGTKGDHMGIWQSVICLRVWPALSATAPLPRGQEPQRMPQGPSWDWGRFEGSVIRKDITLKNIKHSLDGYLSTGLCKLVIDSNHLEVGDDPQTPEDI